MVSVLVTSQSFSGGTNFTADKTNVARSSNMLPLNVFINIWIVLWCVFTISTSPHPIFFPHFRINHTFMVYKMIKSLKLHFRGLVIANIVISHGISCWTKLSTNTTSIPSSRTMARFNVLIQVRTFLCGVVTICAKPNALLFGHLRSYNLFNFLMT